jgi:hypothetical protein
MHRALPSTICLADSALQIKQCVHSKSLYVEDIHPVDTSRTSRATDEGECKVCEADAPGILFPQSGYCRAIHIVEPSHKEQALMTESAGALGWPTLVTPVIDGLRECKALGGAKAVSEIRFPTSIAQIDFGKAKSSALSVHFVTADGSVGGEAAIGA